MGLEVLMARDQLQRPRWRYQRLRGELDGEEVAASAARACRVGRQRRRVGKVAVAVSTGSSSRSSKRAPLLFRMARAGGGRKVRLMRLVLLLPARRVAALFSELARRLAAAASVVDHAAAECPTIVFSSQWGLPVLSHPASGSGAAGRTARLRAFYLERSLSSAGAGAGSPC
ncbi:hypothetical protein GUJ93_ZPchr0007g4792 [Zizania palustris]|uniref:Uncharacterized protein n=1 Tax=Zizania palustris TaxID=103762 RepID=A0A8J5T4F2_ZIZPA|nr:hypothetical protein GUJ93_ZPchr0007g4792 [Zizania palustris]